MIKPVGTSGILVKQAPSKEWGVWRVNEDGFPYLILTLPTVDEAVEIGEKIAGVFRLPCRVNRSEYY